MLLAGRKWSESIDRVQGVTYIKGVHTHAVWQGEIAPMPEFRQLVRLAEGNEGDMARLKAALDREFPDIPFLVAPVGAFPPHPA